MGKNVEKFVEILQNDLSLQEKIKAAIENYSGEQTTEASFQNVLQPIVKEQGCDFTLEDMQEYIKDKATSMQVLSKDEMDQVAGGGGGFGATACASLGIGIGGQAEPCPNDPSSCEEFGFCLVIGLGTGVGACAVPGATKKIS